MSLIKWEPFGQIDDFFADFSRMPFNKIGSDLAVDVYEKDGNVIAEMNIPGINPENVNVSIEDNYLRVSGSHEEEKEDKNKHYYSKEIRRGSFERIVSLPSSVKRDGVEAEYHNGRLSITMPKAEETKDHKITVKIKK